ncbi:MAG: bifunctional phosphoribosylaminoimidazolecarboxamide formyltransferase/IMP cyclohydrolase [Bdellovibrionales bacterium]|nr:bifunctional phosphoribosylaminoimidazolecarboxamide formyltransferase/IMP cyclohydrolase [Bdellovibrionales bacterium]
MKRFALLSVSDKSGVVEFARALTELGFEILTTGGTGKILKENNVPIVSVEEYTGQKEILDGRVKTLHPKIHAGLLARRDTPAHMKQLEEDGIVPIDVLAINLYPFEQHLGTETASSPRKMVELIDIGGPAMLRSAAKNIDSLYAVSDPKDYAAVLDALARPEGESQSALRMRLSQKVFAQLARYNLSIANYFSQLSSDAFATDAQLPLLEEDLPSQLASISGVVLEKKQSLRYGENPKQAAAYYLPQGSTELGWVKHNGKELSYNNFLDFDAAWRMIHCFQGERPTALILKHLNPCGAATRDSLCEALIAAKTSDPRSHFGGIIACNSEVTLDVAEEMAADFAEIVLAPSYSQDALECLQKKKNLRVLEIDLSRSAKTEMRELVSGVLIQEVDGGVSSLDDANPVSQRQATNEEKQDLQFAWTLCAHVKSNAIVIVKNGLLLATGAGQMSRVDAVEVALHKASVHEHDLQGAVAASDAFFPFPDALELLAGAGVTAIVVPSGAKKDGEIIERANQLNVSLLFVDDRHFRH